MSLLDPSRLSADPLEEPGRKDEDLFKDATQAYEDVVGTKGIRSPGIQVADASGGMSWREQLSALNQQGSGKAAPSEGMGWRDQLRALQSPPKEEQGNFSRGLSVSGKQLRQTAYGTAALIGDTVGADGLREWGLKGYKEAEKEVQAISKESDSFTNAVQSGEIGKWLSYSSGYLLGQVGELGVASLAGAALGSLAAPGGGTVAGAVAGAVEKGAVQAGVRGFVAKMIDKQATANLARGMTEKAATEAAIKSVYGTIGATTANTFLNATQELGSIYGDAVEQAALTGQEYSLGKVWLAGIAATAVDSWADSKAVGKVMDAFKGGKGVGGIAMEAFKGGFREGMTEGVQTAIERWGADKDLTSKEAFKEYIDSAAVGILGGSVSGAGSATISKAFSPSDKPKADTELTKEDLDTARDTAQPKLDAPIGIPAEELKATLNSPETMAYLYSKADDKGKADIEKALERAGTLEQFNAVKGQAEAINNGQEQLAEFPEYEAALGGAIAGYAKGAGLNIKKGKTLEAPPSQFDVQPTGTENTQQTQPVGTENTQQTQPVGTENTQQTQAKGAESLDDLGSTPVAKKIFGSVISYLQTTAPLSDEFRNDPLIVRAASSAALAFQDGRTSDQTTQNLFAQVRNKYGDGAVAEIQNPELLRGVNDAIQSADISSSIEAENEQANQTQDQLPDSEADKLYSKDENGKVKAVFFKDLRKVYFANSTWKGGFSTRAFRALELHEIGAHYSLERMVGEERYRQLLADMRALRGQDDRIDAAYASVPKGTAESLVDEEALGYLIENYRNQNIVKRLMQMILDWYQRTFKGKTLTPSDLYLMTVAAYNRHHKEVTRVYMRDNLTDQQKPGTVRVDFDRAVEGNPEARKFLDFMSQFGNSIALSGSLAISTQMPVYRPPTEQIHDLDFRIKDEATLRRIMGKLKEAYPNSGISNQFESWRTGSAVYAFVLDTTDPKSLAIDFFLRRQGGDYEIDGKISKEYVGEDGQAKKIYLVDAKEIFEKKLAMNRGKDVNDAIMTGEYSPLYSKEAGKKPTVSDLPNAIRRVMESLVNDGAMSFEQASAEVVKRIRSSDNWSHLGGNVTPGMLRTAYKSLPQDQRQSDAEVDAVSAQQLRDAVKASQAQKPAKQEKSASEESRDLDLEILDANQKLEQSLSKDWSKKKVSPAEIPDVLAQIENNPEAQEAFNRLEELKKRQKELVAELEDEAKVAKPTQETKADKKAKKEAKKNEEPEVDYGTYEQSSGGAAPMLDESRLSIPLKMLLKGMNRSQINKVRRDLAKVDDEWLENLGAKGLLEHLQPMPVAGRMEALASLAERSSDELVQIGERLAQLNTPEAKQILEFKRRVFGIMNLLNLNAPEAELSTAQNGEVTAKAGVSEEISVASAQQQAQFLRGTIAKLQKAIDDIDALLRGSRVIRDEGGKTFVGVDEADENAYLWGEQGFRTAKNLPQDRLLEVRRQLMDQVREMQTRSTRGVAQLFKRAAKNAEYQIHMAGLQAKRDGIPAIVVDPIINQAREQIVGLMNDKAVSQAIDVPSVQEALKVALDEAPLEAGDVVNQLADGIKDRSLTQDEMFTLASTAIRSGRLNQGQLIQALRDRGIDTPQEMLSASPLLAFQTRMMDYLKQHGNHPSYRMAWLNSMDQLVKRHPTLLKLNIFPEAEKVAYEMWKERTDALANRRTTDFVMENSNDAADAFRDMLFTKYSLSQMRGAVPISEREMMALKGTIGDMEEAWFQDVNFALKLRPDLKSQLLDPEEGMIAPTDVQAFLSWQEKNNAKLDREADAKARIPYYEALASFDGSLPEGVLPGSKDAEEASRKRDILYRRLKTMIARAELDELPKIIHNAQQLYTKIASSTKTEAALDQMISDYLDMKQAQDDKINGQTIEQFYRMAERGAETENQVSDKELDDMDSEDFEYNFDEDLGDNENETEDGPFRKRGVWSGEYSAAIVDGWVKKITAKWGAAPQITVLQNATMLPEPLRSKALARTGDLLDAAGLFDSETGHVYVFSDFIGSEADAQFVVFHEVYGHRGLRQFLGAKFDAFLERMYQIYPGVKKAADEFMQTHGVGKLEAIDEVLSDMAGTNPDIGPVKSWIGRMVVGLREIGFNRVADWIAKISNAELSYYLKGAREAAQNGGYVSNGAPGVIRLAEAEKHERLSEMFALRGDKTTAFARFNPVSQTWFVYLANGDDIRAGNNTAITSDNYADVLKLMRSRGTVEFRKRSGVLIQDRKDSDFIKLPKAQDLTGIKAWMRGMITEYQNEYRPVFDLVNRMRALGRVTERMDIVDALMRYERKTAAILDEFRRRFARPLESLVEEAGKQGANQQIIDRFLLARHAKERNEQIARINEKYPDGGSGMRTKVAERYLKQLQKQPYWQTLQEIGRVTDEISNKKLKYQFDTGMITAKQYQAMQVYKHYVNLSGRSDLKLDEFDDPMMLAGGSKFNVKGKEKRATGRKSEATDIMARTLLGMEAALIRGQKNQIAQRVLAFFEANYDPNFVTINKIAYKQVIGDDGMVTEKEDENYYGNKNVMVAKVNGIPSTIEFKDTSPDSFAEAIHGVVGFRDDNALLERMGAYNRFVGQMLTTYNPVWGAVNFVRDVQTMFFNAAADGRLTKAQAAAMVQKIPEAMKIAYYMARVENLKQTGVRITDEQARIYREMKLNGGLTSFLNRKDLPSQVEDLQRMLGEQGKFQNAKDKFQNVLDLIEQNMSLPIEVAPRLAAYMVMKENGFSVAEAARFAGEITVNFNMRGASQAARQLYLFFNPAVQGSAKILSLFATLDHDYKLKFKTKGFAYAAAWIGVGALMNLVGRAMGDDDEAGRNALDKVPVWKRATSIVLAPDVPGAAIPIPYGWNAFYAIGHFMMDTMLGKQPLAVSVGRIAKSTIESFIPVGGDAVGELTEVVTRKALSPISSAPDMDVDYVTAGLRAVAPTAVLPMVDWIANKNRYGAPIRMDDSSGGAQMPDTQMAFRSVNPISKAAMESLHEITGGNKFNPKGVDINPAAIDFFVGSYLPGFVNEIYKGAGLAVRAARGEEVKNAPIPLIDRFTAKIPESFDAGAFRRAREMVETKYREWENMPNLRREISKEYPGLLRAHAVVQSSNQEIRELNATLLKLENNPRMSDEDKVKKLNYTRERVKQVQERAVKAVMKAGPQFREAVMASD